VKNIPIEYNMLETDCPYLTPHPHRGERNDSSYMYLAAEKIAKIKNISVDEVKHKTSENAVSCFNLKL
jgi:TatD DNase family protein